MTFSEKQQVKAYRAFRDRRDFLTSRDWKAIEARKIRDVKRSQANRDKSRADLPERAPDQISGTAFEKALKKK